MKKEVAITEAKEFLNQKNLENIYKEKFKWILGEPIELEKAWYFDYKFELINPKENFGIGGAPGFKINKENQTVENVSWEEYNSVITKLKSK